MNELGLAVPLGLFCILMGAVVFLFALYHLYLIARNTTTNETFKWQDVADWLRSVARRRRRREQLLAQRARVTMTASHEALDKKDSKTKKKSNKHSDKQQQKASSSSSQSADTTKDDSDSSDSEIEQVVTPTVRQMSNIYNLGVWQNYKQALFPPSAYAKFKSS